MQVHSINGAPLKSKVHRVQVRFLLAHVRFLMTTRTPCACHDNLLTNFRVLLSYPFSDLPPGNFQRKSDT